MSAQTGMQTGSIRPRLYIPTTIHRSYVKLRNLFTTDGRGFSGPQPRH